MGATLISVSDSANSLYADGQFESARTLFESLAEKGTSDPALYLADERVWNRTHRVGGRYFFGIGVVFIIATFLLPTQLFLPLFVISLLTVTFGLFVYSYVIYRRINA